MATAVRANFIHFELWMKQIETGTMPKKRIAMLKSNVSYIEMQLGKPKTFFLPKLKLGQCKKKFENVKSYFCKPPLSLRNDFERKTLQLNEDS